MNTRNSHRARAIVLHTLDYGESDRIATFYTREFGKLKGIAKGARRSRRRFANSLEPFSFTQVLFSRRGGGDSLAMVDQCEIIDHFPMIRSDLEKSVAASYLVELTGAFTVEGKRNEAVFQLLVDFLSLMENGPFRTGLLSFFEIRLLGLAGYEPILDRCSRCHVPLDAGRTFHFSNSRGGLQCSRCVSVPEAAPALSLGTIRSLLHGKALPARNLSRLLLSPRADDESRRLLVSFIRHILGRELKSWQVLRQLRQLDAINVDTC
ncbi:MAG: DNA repair protein RecO [Pseudomonadota bacterium]|nr:DNA repair protein RecO [Pseudomonadota bacterium]